MIVVRVVRQLTVVLVTLSLALNLYIYNYPLLHRKQCNWADFGNDRNHDLKILAFGDPQIRGAFADSSWRTRLDIYGNDYYLHHVYSVLSRRLNPSHVAVMGDLVSSQWIGNEEFYIRGERYKERIFNGNHKFINVSGNHDVGYAGEMTVDRVNRYETVYGKVNYVQVLEGLPRIRLVVLNSLALDGPAYEKKFKMETLEFLDHVENMRFEGATILLLHVPLYKPKGICKDGPLFEYYQESGDLREQNHLSYSSSELILSKVFGPFNVHGGVILTGHDHEGCQSIYAFDEFQGWYPLPFRLSDLPPLNVSRSVRGTVREITVRSMMGEFGGNGGLLTASWDHDSEIWDFDYSLCPFAVQHIWWVTQVVTIIASIGLFLTLLSTVIPQKIKED